ncbi:hypothetical protein L2E82_15978 [Cichorium intybus]|uniref:Uncharacterized protein n=1 Tax=Cichorium intybus TaxID=13427 RepID=A0ACB9F4V3_CICIN|nr:hypothetical protein L2E82_15978 [Cichorium intybus]
MDENILIGTDPSLYIPSTAADNQLSQPPSNRSQLTTGNFRGRSICAVSHNHQFETKVFNQIHLLSNGLICRLNLIDRMALTNLILTVAGVSAVILLMRSDVKQSASIFKRNVRQIRHWLEEESASAAKEMEKAKPKELPKKDIPKDD